MPHHQGSMKIRKIISDDGKIYYSPLTHKVIFRHCANGPIATDKEFERTVRPLLYLHGVCEIRLV